MLRYIFLIFILIAGVFLVSCTREKQDDVVTIALSEKFSTLNTLTTSASDAVAERVRDLMFNSLVKKNENFEYVGDLAQDIQTSEDGKTITFVLRDNIKFHNGQDFTSADVKYTFDELFKNESAYKAGAFYETINDEKKRYIESIETPDAKTVKITISRPAVKNQLLSNFVAVPIIANGTIAEQETKPIGTGPFKFVSYNQSQNTVDLEAFPNYFEGAPKVQKIRVKTVADANSLQAELQSGGVDIAPLPTNLSPDTLNSLGNLPNLEVKKFNGSNIQYLQFNTESKPLDNAKLRQAIAYAIDREKIIKELLSGQATLAYSILPAESWAYNAGTKYSYDPAKAKELLKESGYKNEPLKYKFSAGSAATSQYAQVIQNALKEIGLNVEIEPLEGNVLRQQMAQGQYQMTTGIWIGGNQDPIFLKDLFSAGAIPGEKIKCCNRSRYSNSEVDKLLEQAVNAQNRDEAKQYYSQVQEIISRDVPMFPLWYPANMAVINKRIGNVNIGASGSWNFVKDITLNQ